jgi:hypothetical protein
MYDCALAIPPNQLLNALISDEESYRPPHINGGIQKENSTFLGRPTNQGVVGSNPAGRASHLKGLHHAAPSLFPAWIFLRDASVLPSAVDDGLLGPAGD